jgi:hypothetical protein
VRVSPGDVASVEQGPDTHGLDTDTVIREPSGEPAPVPNSGPRASDVVDALPPEPPQAVPPERVERDQEPNPLFDFLTSSISAGSIVGAPRVLAFEDALRAKGRGEGEGFLDHYARRRDEYLAGEERMRERSPVETTAGDFINPQLLAGPLAAGRSAAAPTVGTLMKQGAFQSGAAALGRGSADLTKGEFLPAAAQTAAAAAMGGGLAGIVGGAVPWAAGKVRDLAEHGGHIAAALRPVLGPTGHAAARIAAAFAKAKSAAGFNDPFGPRYMNIGNTQLNAVVTAVRALPGLLAQPELGEWVTTFRGALARDAAEGGEDNLKRAHFILSNSDPDYQEFVNQAQEQSKE